MASVTARSSGIAAASSTVADPGSGASRWAVERARLDGATAISPSRRAIGRGRGRR